MDENLLGYLLDALDESTRAQVEKYLRGNAAARERLEQLRAALIPLADDRDEAAAPAGLVMRTLTFVAEHACRELPRLPRPTRAPSGRVALWRRADVLVAACLLLTVLGLAGPALFQLRKQHAKVECQANLQRFHAALAAYHRQRGHYPNVAQEPHDVAGMIAPLLQEAGVLPDAASNRCPANGGPTPLPFTAEQLRQLSPEEFAEIAPKLVPCYAYSLGYRDAWGYHGPSKPPGAGSTLPLMADAPPRFQAVNSDNHGRLGQNILFNDGHVTFATHRQFGSDRDVFLNLQSQEAAGIGADDIVLGHSAARP